MRKKSFIPLFATNFIGVYNDNFHKTLTMFIVSAWIPDEKLRSTLLGVTAGMFVLPYILFSPFADRLMQYFSKKNIFRVAKWAELPIMGIAIAGFLLKSLPVVILSVFLMGLQSALYSPVKYALIRDIGGKERISVGLGWMDGLSFLGVLFGTVGASFLVDRVPQYVYFGSLLLFAALGVAVCYVIAADEEKETTHYPISPVRFLTSIYHLASRYRHLNLIIGFSGIFWLVAGMMQMGLLLYGTEVLKISSFQTGLILALAAVGIALGNVIAGIVDRRVYLLGALPLSGILSGILLFVLFGASLSPIGFSVVLGLFAFSVGFFKLPLDAEIQKMVKGPMLNTILSYFNQVTFLFILAASGVYVAVSALWGPRAFLAAGGTLLTGASIVFFFVHPGSFCFVGRFFLHRRYRVKVENLDLVAENGSYLVMPNHPALIDPVLLRGEFYRHKLMPLVTEDFFRDPLTRHVLKMMDCVAVPDLTLHRSRESIARVQSLEGVVLDALKKGGNVLLYPAGHIYTDGRESLGNRQLGYLVARQLPENTRVLLVRTTGLWGSIWSRYQRRNSPPFGTTLLKSLALYFGTFFRKRRTVTIHIEERTADVVAWSRLSRLEFNRKLENFYNDEE